jgi:phosphatidylserine/phosphatidylglycerophosphate/cardiolipin synthase-like enzyme
MKFLKTLALSSFLALSAFADINVYFNQNPQSSYIDPYRKNSRPGDNLEGVILEQIKSAKKTIYLAVQEFRLPLVAMALVEKKAQGVDVRVVLENRYNFDVLGQREVDTDGEYEASKLKELKAFIDLNRDGKISREEQESRDAMFILNSAKIPIMDDTSDTSRGSGLMHHKFMVVDGRITVVSTANFTMSCIHGDVLAPSSRGNANSMIVVNSPSFGKIFSDEFGQLWGNGKRGNFGHNKTYRGPMTTTVKGTKISIQFSPTSQRYHWEESTNGLIASALAKANQSIKALLFVFSDQRLADVLQKRSDNGTEVGVIIEPKFAFRDYSELLDLMGIEMLNLKCQYEADNNPWKRPAKEAGMAKLANGDMLHHKFAVIDNKTVVVGSQNWSGAANFINDETLIIIQNPHISEQYTREYERVKRSSLMGIPVWVREDIRKQQQNCNELGRY